MAAYTRRERVITRIEYVVPSGSHFEEIGKAYNGLAAELDQCAGPTARRSGMPTIFVDACDDEIVLWAKTDEVRQ